MVYQLITVLKLQYNTNNTIVVGNNNSLVQISDTKFFLNDILTEIFSVCVFASTQKQKSPLTPPVFTFSNKAKKKSTMDKLQFEKFRP